MPVTRYQEGSIERVKRAKGPDVWACRFRQEVDGEWVHRSRIIGNLKEYKSKADAKRAVENLRAEINAVEGRAGRMTIEDAWGHFQKNELEDPGSDRSPTTIATYRDYFGRYILPQWRTVAIDDVKPVAVEKWLRSLPYADATKAKCRNHLSALFSHLIRWELYTRLNPIASVRQGAGRRRDPDVLTLPENECHPEPHCPAGDSSDGSGSRIDSFAQIRVSRASVERRGLRRTLAAFAKRGRADGSNKAEDTCFTQEYPHDS